MLYNIFLKTDLHFVLIDNYYSNNTSNTISIMVNIELYNVYSTLEDFKWTITFRFKGTAFA